MSPVAFLVRQTFHLLVFATGLRPACACVAILANRPSQQMEMTVSVAR